MARKFTNYGFLARISLRYFLALQNLKINIFWSENMKITFFLVRFFLSTVFFVCAEKCHFWTLCSGEKCHFSAYKKNSTNFFDWEERISMSKLKSPFCTVHRSVQKFHFSAHTKNTVDKKFAPKKRNFQVFTLKKCQFLNFVLKNVDFLKFAPKKLFFFCA